MKTLLWLDDMRNPEEQEWGQSYPLLKDSKIVWVKSYQEFKDFITSNGIPDVIFFDHDLEKGHYTPEKYWNDYAESKKFQQAQNHKNTGYDAAVFLVKHCKENGLDIPEFYSQSANPVGRDHILCLLNWEKQNT